MASLWLPAKSFASITGATGPSPVGSDTTNYWKSAAYVFPDALGIITTNFIMPTDWDMNAITAYFHWAKGALGTGNVAWDWYWAQVGQGDQVDAVAGTPLSTTVAVPSIVDNLARTTIGTFFVPAGYRMLRGAVRRNTTGDTYAGNVHLLGVELVYFTD